VKLRMGCTEAQCLAAAVSGNSDDADSESHDDRAAYDDEAGSQRLDRSGTM
jgi:hypothetical protein